MKRLILQQRDRELVVGAYRHGFLLRDHACKLYFPDCDLRRANRRLLALKRHEVLIAHPLPLGAFMLGVEGFLPNLGQFAYRVGENGVPLVAEALELDLTSVRKRLRASPSYLGHAVAVTALHVALREFQDSQSYRLHQFLTEGEARHQFEWRESPNVGWKNAEVRPDALAWLEVASNSIGVLLEADRGSQSKAAFLEKLNSYSIYRRTPFFAKRFGGAPLILWIVTTSSTRRDTLAELVNESDLAGLPGVALTTFHDFLSHGPLGPIWHIPALGDERNQTHALPDL